MLQDFMLFVLLCQSDMITILSGISTTHTSHNRTITHGNLGKEWRGGERGEAEWLWKHLVIIISPKKTGQIHSPQPADGIWWHFLYLSHTYLTLKKITLAGLSILKQSQRQEDQLLQIWTPPKKKCSVYTGCFTTLGHNCRRWFPRSLWSKKFI